MTDGLRVAATVERRRGVLLEQLLIYAVALHDPPRERLHRAVHRLVDLEDPAGLDARDASSMARVPYVAIQRSCYSRVLELRFDAQREHADLVDSATRAQRGQPSEGQQASFELR